MSDLIDRQNLINLLISRVNTFKGTYGDLGGAVSGIRKLVETLPSIEIERTAKVQVNVHPCGISGICTSCGGDVYNVDPYCSHCGAKLDWFNGEDK